MKLITLILGITCLTLFTTPANSTDISQLISEKDFSAYNNVADFIDAAPKVTVIVQPEANDIKEYGTGVVKTLTGSDCDRDGKMDDNATCNAVYVKLWLKYKR
jgi:hypothetical protein